jgi:hypothetical protein
MVPQAETTARQADNAKGRLRMPHEITILGSSVIF